MAFNEFRFFIGRGILVGQGVPVDTATRLAFVPGVIEVPLVQSVLLSTALGRARAPVGEAAALTGAADLVEVPDVTGDTFKQAKPRLEAVGLTAEQADVRSEDSTRPGRVIRQSPEEGEVVPVGTLVTLFVRKAAAGEGDGKPGTTPRTGRRRTPVQVGES